MSTWRGDPKSVGDAKDPGLPHLTLSLTGSGRLTAGPHLPSLLFPVSCRLIRGFLGTSAIHVGFLKNNTGAEGRPLFLPNWLMTHTKYSWQKN